MTRGGAWPRTVLDGDFVVHVVTGQWVSFFGEELLDAHRHLCGSTARANDSVHCGYRSARVHSSMHVGHDEMHAIN